MFFFFEEEKDLMGHGMEIFRYVNKGIFFINMKSRTLLTEFFNSRYFATLPLKYFLITPRINWIIDFSTIYEQILFAIGKEEIEEILNFFGILRQKCRKLSEHTIACSLLNIYKAEEVEYTQKEILRFSKSFLQILELSNKNDAFYKMLKGSQKRKVIYLAVLCSILYATKRNKIIVFLENVDIALCATTPYLRTSIIIKFLCFLELTLCPIIIVIPCNERIFEEYKRMYEYITS